MRIAVLVLACASLVSYGHRTRMKSERAKGILHKPHLLSEKLGGWKRQHKFKSHLPSQKLSGWKSILHKPHLLSQKLGSLLYVKHVDMPDSLRAVALLVLTFTEPIAGFLSAGHCHRLATSRADGIVRSQIIFPVTLGAVEATRHARVCMRIRIGNPVKRFRFRIGKGHHSSGGGTGGGDVERFRGGSDSSDTESPAVILLSDTEDSSEVPEPEKDTAEEESAEKVEQASNSTDSKVQEAIATKKVLIIMSDTGGGHKASGRAIQRALEELYPDKLDFEIVDIWTDYGQWPFNQLVSSYAYMAQHTWMWRLMYQYAQFPPTRWFTQRWCAMACWGGVRDCFEEHEPDMIISVHPLCQQLPLRILNWMHGGEEKRREKLPFVTVVTDLGSSHPTWFHNKVDMTFVPSDVVEDIAKRKLPEESFKKFGLPIGPGFKARKDKEKHSLQAELGLNKGVRTALVVGGGDGVGSLESITKELADELGTEGMESQLVVVCGKNEHLKAKLEAEEWPENVHVSVQGFVRNMDEWMGAADAIVTKAGPGTIAEACASGLPIMLSSFLPGQEAGNVPFVVDGGFGAFSRDPKVIAQTVSGWLKDSGVLADMSQKSKQAGRPQATRQIAAELGKHLFEEK